MPRVFSSARRYSRTHRGGKPDRGEPHDRADSVSGGARGGISSPRLAGPRGWHTRARHFGYTLYCSLSRRGRCRSDHHHLARCPAMARETALSGMARPVVALFGRIPSPIFGDGPAPASRTACVAAWGTENAAGSGRSDFGGRACAVGGAGSGSTSSGRAIGRIGGSPAGAAVGAIYPRPERERFGVAGRKVPCGRHLRLYQFRRVSPNSIL